MNHQGTISFLVGMDIDDAEKEMARLKKQILKLESDLSVKKFKLNGLEESVEKAKEEMEALLKANRGGWKAEDEFRFEELGQYVDNTEKEIEKLKTSIEETGYSVGGLSQRFGELEQKANQMRQGAEGAAQSVQEMGSARGVEQAASAMDNAREKAQSLGERLKQGVAQGASSAGLAVASFGKAAISILGKILSVAGKVGIALAKMVGKGVLTGLKKLGSLAKTAAAGLKSLFSSTKKANGGFNLGLKTILKYGLGIRSLYVLFNKLRSAIAEGFTNLSQFSTSTNAALTSIKNALDALKNALATAFAPILEVVTPLLLQFIDLLTRAADAVARLTAMLAGKTSYIRAKKALEGEEKALEGVSGAAEDAAGSLAKIDEIDTIATEKQSGGGSAADAIADAFEEVELEPFEMPDWGQAFSDLLDKLLLKIPDLKDALKKLAEWINNLAKKLYDMFTFPGVYDKVVRLGEELAKALNDFVNQVDWFLLGKALGAGLNLALGFLVAALYTFDWTNLGLRLAQLINGLVSEVDWYKFGMLLWAKFKIALETLAGFLYGLNMPQLAKAASNIALGFFNSMQETIDSINWGRIGQQVATFLNEIDWEGVLTSTAGAIRKAINGLLSMVSRFIVDTDWSRIGAAFGSAISNLLINLNWTQFGHILSNGFKAVFDFLYSAITSMDWHRIGERVRDALISIDWAGVFTSLCNFIGSIFGGLAAFLGGLLGSGFRKAYDYIASAIEEVGGDIATGFWLGVFRGLGDIASWIYNNIFKPFIDGFKAAFGIASPSTVMAEMGTYLVDGLLQGIQNTWEQITQFFTTALENLKATLNAAWEAIKASTSAAWESIKATIVAKFTAMKTAIVTAAKNLATTVVNAFNTLKSSLAKISWADIGKNLMNTFLSGLQSAWQSITQWVTNAINSLMNTIRNAISSISSAISSIKMPSISIGSSKAKSATSTASTFSSYSVPHLASGTVVPQNREFLAVLGDNKKETEVVSPLSTIQEAVQNAMQAFSGNNGSQTINLVVDGKTLASVVVPQINNMTRAAGRSVLLG